MFWYNVVKDGDTDLSSIYWKDVEKWKVIPESVLISCNEDDPDDKEAKLAELARWNQYNVYKEVDNVGQNYVTSQWVMSQKYVNGVRQIKARLVARGFQESDDQRKDSPTATVESIRLMLVLASSNGWKLNSLDIKSAFLQGDELKRDVYLRPPKEAQTNSLWTHSDDAPWLVAYICWRGHLSRRQRIRRAMSLRRQRR